MKWIVDVYEPEQPDAREKFISGYEVTNEEWEKYVLWVNKYRRGLPKMFNARSVMEEKHIIGLYED